MKKEIIFEVVEDGDGDNKYLNRADTCTFINVTSFMNTDPMVGMILRAFELDDLIQESADGSQIKITIQTGD